MAYDADDEAFSIFLASSKVYGKAVGLAIRCANRPGGSYVGTNAMNAKRTISIVHRTEIAIAGEPFDRDGVLKGFSLSVHVTVGVVPEVAPLVRTKLAIVAVVWPGRGEGGATIAMEAGHLTPTIDDPLEVVTVRTLINAFRVELWIYRSDAGQVFIRCEWSRCDGR